MKIEFKVHGTSKQQVNAATQIDGETIMAQVPCFEVELVTVAERSGSLTLRFVGSAIEEAQSKFAPDSVHVWEL